MSYEVWGDGDEDDNGMINEEEAEELMRFAAAWMREMLARFVEQGGDATTSASIRANWIPDWGKDPGKMEGPIPSDLWKVY